MRSPFGAFTDPRVQPQSRARRGGRLARGTGRGRLRRSAGRLQLLLGVQRKLDHALEQLLCGNAGEVAEHELLDVEPHEVAQLKRAIARREDEVAMAAVDDDDVALGFEAAPPEL